ncbi:MAG: hypothetical protein Q9167_008141, partial [Letrouitia subvulpina]
MLSSNAPDLASAYRVDRGSAASGAMISPGVLRRLARHGSAVMIGSLFALSASSPLPHPSYTSSPPSHPRRSRRPSKYSSNTTRLHRAFKYRSINIAPLSPARPS